MADLSAEHRLSCDGADHVQPVGEYEGQPYDGQHGEPSTGGLPEQCMCGHLTYFSCPDWFPGEDEPDVIPPLPDSFANPYLLCPRCQRQVTNVDFGTSPARSLPCGHTEGYADVCFSWDPVQGCTCPSGTHKEAPHG
ncbi:MULTISPECIES: hypothetical protein [unclassified Crossiella]|uniref:hypothetical protein n=1 Tax=unclassified Crossiella TaxID=2620835 RepID=UPI001FFF5753|nr:MULTISPECIES: hypothetical protein [unclassified Crossiella]MCK2242172.1 hypothetical protein [Crossiella sp. S99.2]MCK2256075.1 hypothetical protein [Crossiella sp. S99.1]